MSDAALGNLILAVVILGFSSLLLIVLCLGSALGFRFLLGLIWEAEDES